VGSGEESEDGVVIIISVTSGQHPLPSSYLPVTREREWSVNASPK
jgi:hypothetical protein